MIFKVKTTQPSWYYVRPNQSVLEVGAKEEVVIALVDTECNRFLADYAADKAEKVDKHRFLVQAKCISDEQYTRLNALKPSERGDEYNKLWEDSPKNDRKLKLKVEFSYPPASRSPSSGALKTESDVAKQLARSDAPLSTGSSYEAVLGELQTLRKKYDAVVEYTVHLTAERDTLVGQLEEYKKDAAGNKKITASPKKGDRGTNRIQQGFSLLSIAVIAAVFFLLGRYVKFI